MQASDIFLSYSREDQAVARRYADAFEALGLSVWWDVALRSGQTYDAVTETALKSAKAVVVLWSKTSVASRWVRSEATLADRKGTLLPALIEPCERPIMFELTQTAELSHWTGAPKDKAWLAFAADVRHMVAKKEAQAAEEVVPTAPPGSGERGDAPSLGILPFTNRSGLPEDEVFAEGMVEDLIAAMSRGFTTRVLASGATASFRRGAYSDIAAVGRQLGVRYLLEGNIRRVDDTLRVTTQVVEAETGKVLWSGRFYRPLNELAQLQEELVLDVAATLEMKFQTIELQRALRKPSDITAWEAVQRCFAALRQPDPMSIMRAVKEAQRAVDIDPEYALAHAALAHSMGVVYLYGMPDDPATERRIREHIDRALALGSDDDYVLGTSSQALCCIGCPEEALSHMRRGVRRSPSCGPFYFNLGWSLGLLDRVEEALAALAEADRLMPDWAFRSAVDFTRANLHARAGRWAEAEAAIDAALALNPGYDAARQMRAVILRRSGQGDQARAVFATVTSRGVVLDQVLTYYRRAFANSAVADEVCDHIRALWAEAAGTSTA